MNNLEIKLSGKQNTALTLLQDPQVTELYYGGSAGSGKTLILCIWILLECRNYQGIRIGLGRKELTRLKQTTLTSLLREAHPLLGVKASDFTYQDQKGLITYKNSSSILLFDLARQPSDPDFDTLGSLNLTHCVIDEGGEIVKKAKDVFGSRRNRFLNDKYNITGKLVVTGNPSKNFTRQEYYEPFISQGGGDYQKWKTGSVEINGELKDSYRAFVRALPTDNPFISRNYIEMLKQLPPQERKRLLEGNWDYMDDDDMLFKSQLLDRATTSMTQAGKKYIGVDVADKGKDSTVFTLIEGNVATETKKVKVDTEGEKAISELYALELIKFAQQRGFTRTDAKDIAIEGNGVGVGMRDFMRAKGWYVDVYEATARSRSNAFFKMYQDMDKGELQLHNEMDYLTETKKQLMVLTYDFNEALEPVVLSKKKIKEILGYSPDESDSLMIANWKRSGGSNAPKSNQALIIV